MARLFPVIRRVIAAASGAGQVISVVVPGINLTNRLSQRTDIAPALVVSQGPTSHRGQAVVTGIVTGLQQATARLTQVVPGFTLTNLLSARLAQVIPGFVFVQGPTSVTPATTVAGIAESLVVSGGPNAGTYLAVPGIGLTNRITPAPVLKIPAVTIIQVKYDLTKFLGADTQAPVGTAWTNPANALGTNNAARATCVGGVTAATFGIELNYANSVNKAELTILTASLRVYFTVVDALGLCTRTLSYNIGGGLVTLETGTGARAGPFVDYTIPITTWTQFDAFAFRMVCAYAVAAAASNATLDAAELTITATRTEDPNP